MGEERHERITEWLDIDLGRLSSDERKGLVTEVCDTLSAGDLRELRDIMEEKRRGKLDEARQVVIEEMRVKLSDMGIDPDAVVVSFGRRHSRRDRGATLAVKYRSPDGQTWSGRGFAPNWLTKLEAEGHNREEYRVEEETP